MKPIFLLIAFIVMTSVSAQVIKNEVSTGQAKHPNLPLVDLDSRLQDKFNAVNYQGYYLANASLPDVSGSPLAFNVIILPADTPASPVKVGVGVVVPAM